MILIQKEAKMCSEVNFQNKITLIIPSRSVDFLLFESVSEIRKLYPFVKIIVILDEIDEKKNRDFDENVTILKSENLNMSAKRNQGVRLAQTEYLGFIDSDAYPCENWIESAVDFLDKNLDYSAVTGNQLLPENDNFEKQCLRLIRFCKLFTYSKWCKVIDLNVKEQDCYEFMTSNLIMRKSVYDKLGGMDETLYLAEDNEFADRMVKNNYKIRFVPKIRVFHHECSSLPFLKKVFSMSLYYAKEFSTRTGKKSINEYLSIFFPLLAFIFFIFVLLTGVFLNENILILLLLPFAVLLLFVFYAVKLANKINCNKILAFFYIYFIFIMFCVFFLFGLICGLFNFSCFDARNTYKHY